MLIFWTHDPRIVNRLYNCYYPLLYILCFKANYSNYWKAGKNEPFRFWFLILDKFPDNTFLWKNHWSLTRISAVIENRWQIWSKWSKTEEKATNLITKARWSTVLSSSIGIRCRISKLWMSVKVIADQQLMLAFWWFWEWPPSFGFWEKVQCNADMKNRTIRSQRLTSIFVILRSFSKVLTLCYTWNMYIFKKDQLPGI